MNQFETQLERLLREPLDEARERARTEFDRLAAPHGNRLVLFGVGNLGRRVLGRLRQDGIEPLAFSDNQPGNWGKTVDGLIVLSPEEAADRFGGNSAFVVTIFNPDHSFPETQKQLLGWVAPRLSPSFPCVGNTTKPFCPTGVTMCRRIFFATPVHCGRPSRFYRMMTRAANFSVKSLVVFMEITS